MTIFFVMNPLNQIDAEHCEGRLFHSASAGSDHYKATMPRGDSCRSIVPTKPSAHPVPLICVLHGHGRDDGGLVEHVLTWCRSREVVVLLPQSQGSSWDLLRGGYGPDVQVIDNALAWALQTYEIDPMRTALCGFSDGGSYSLSLGLKNGDCFSHLLGFSVGFAMTSCRRGHPFVSIAHGVNDPVLPLSAGLGISQRLSQDGYSMTYEEFDGGHSVPGEVARKALSLWLPPDKDL